MPSSLGSSNENSVIDTTMAEGQFTPVSSESDNMGSDVMSENLKVSGTSDESAINNNDEKITSAIEPDQGSQPSTNPIQENPAPIELITGVNSNLCTESNELNSLSDINEDTVHAGDSTFVPAIPSIEVTDEHAELNTSNKERRKLETALELTGISIPEHLSCALCSFIVKDPVNVTLGEKEILACRSCMVNAAEESKELNAQAQIFLCDVLEKLEMCVTCVLCSSTVKNPVHVPWDSTKRPVCRSCISEGITKNNFICPLTGEEDVALECLLPNDNLEIQAMQFSKEWLGVDADGSTSKEIQSSLQTSTRHKLDSLHLTEITVPENITCALCHFVVNDAVYANLAGTSITACKSCLTNATLESDTVVKEVESFTANALDKMPQIPVDITCIICESLLKNAVHVPWDDTERPVCKSCISEGIVRNDFVCPVTGEVDVELECLLPNDELNQMVKRFKTGCQVSGSGNQFPVASINLLNLLEHEDNNEHPPNRAITSTEPLASRCDDQSLLSFGSDLKSSYEDNYNPVQEASHFSLPSNNINAKRSGKQLAVLRAKTPVAAKQHLVEDDYEEVESVLDWRIHKGRDQYLIKWKGHPDESNTWEPQDNLCDTVWEEAKRIKKNVIMRKKQPNIITPEKSAHNFELSSAASDPLRDDPEFKKGLNQVLREKLIQMRQYDDQGVFDKPFWEHTIFDDVTQQFIKVCPDYTSVIKQPICFSIIEEKIARSRYNGVENFGADVMLMFANCREYNAIDDISKPAIGTTYNDDRHSTRTTSNAVGQQSLDEKQEEAKWYCTYADTQERIFKETILPSARGLVKGVQRRLGETNRKAASDDNTTAKSFDDMSGSVGVKGGVSTSNISSSAALVGNASVKEKSGVKNSSISINIVGVIKEGKPKATIKLKQPTTLPRKRPAHVNRGGSATKRQKSTLQRVASPYSFCSSAPSAAACKIGNDSIDKITTGKSKPSFFKHFFQGRCITRPYNYAPGITIERTFFHNGSTFELISSKMMKNKRGGNHFQAQEADAEFLYVATEGTGMPKVNLQDELDTIVRFGSLGAKTCSRLEHLQSEVKFLQDIHCSDIEFIEEQGNEGCGFVPQGFFGGFKGCTSNVFQIRIVGPRLGLIKGLLLVKRGINKIQIPASMLKALPSDTSFDEIATLIIKTTAPSQPNKDLGKLLDPNAEPRETFMEECQKPLLKLAGDKKGPTMYQRILLGFGVSETLCDAYAKQARYAEGLRHATMMGVADPTGKIPYGQVFIPGYATNANNERDIFGRCLKYGKVFISRSPCVEPEDAKILKVLKTKPDDMGSADWSFLCDEYSFGTVIFGLPKSKYDAPIPSMIADGDLDGDLLWHEEILGSLLRSKSALSKKARSVLRTLEPPDKTKCYVDKTSKLDKPYDKDWLKKAQSKMLDFEKSYLASQLVGALYNLCKEFKDIFDEDAVAYAKAYKDAMDVQKHGGVIYLPAHLHENLKPELRELLVSD